MDTALESPKEACATDGVGAAAAALVFPKVKDAVAGVGAEDAALAVPKEKDAPEGSATAAGFTSTALAWPKEKDGTVAFAPEPVKEKPPEKLEVARGCDGAPKAKTVDAAPPRRGS